MSGLWARWRVRLGYPLAVGFALLARPAPESLCAGAAIAMIGLLLRGAAAGHLYKHERLAQSGPYRFTRNPLYLGSAGMAAGLLFAGRSWVAALLVALYFAVFYVGVMRSEETELRTLYGSDFEEYARQVPIFFPSLRPMTPSGTRFSWKQYKVNREYEAAIGFLVALALLYAKMKYLP